MISTLQEEKVNDGLHLVKSNSMGSIFVSATMDKPDVTTIIRSVAIILRSQMIEVSQTKSTSKVSQVLSQPMKRYFNRTWNSLTKTY